MAAPVFIAWSGQESLRAAELLQQWLQDVLQIRSWVSRTSLRRGGRWFMELNEGLEDTTFGIACVSRANIEAPWINFEMGAVAKKLRGTSVVPFLMDDLDLEDVRSPLAQFQAVRRDYKDIFELLRSLREACNLTLTDDELRQRHDEHWPALLSALEGIAVQGYVGSVVENGIVRSSLRREEDQTYLVIEAASPKPIYLLRWALPDDRGEWDIPPSLLTIDEQKAAYPIGLLRPGQVVRVPAGRKSPIEVPLHIRFEWFDRPDGGQFRQMECWIEP